MFKFIAGVATFHMGRPSINPRKLRSEHYVDSSSVPSYDAGPQHMALRMETRVSGDVIVLHCAGRIVFGDEAAAFRARIKNILLGTQHIVVNLDEIEYIDSAGLGTLVGLLASTRNQHGEIKLVRPTRRVTDLLRQTRLSTVFHCYESDEEAVAAFGAELAL